MPRIRRTLPAVATFVLVLSLVAAAFPGPAVSQGQERAQVGGKWLLKMQGSESMMMDFYLELVQDGAQVTGTLEGSTGEQEVEGKVEGNRLSFSVHVASPEGGFTINFTATVEDEKTMSGTMEAGEGQFSAPFTAERREQS